MQHLFLTSAIGIPGIAASILAKLDNKKFRKTVYITTAIECEPEEIGQEWDDSDHEAVSSLSSEIFNYSLTGKSEAVIRADLKDIDCLFIAGGNTFYLLQESQKSNFSNIVHDLVTSGIIYIGSSAGSIIAGPDLSPILGVDDVAVAPSIGGYVGYNLVDFTTLVHWGSKEFKKEYLDNSFAHIYSSKAPLIALNNYEYVEVIDDNYRVIDTRHEK
ncbi:MAG: Type 1 glutamine amidotransferase-like domain-containing protein [Microgenomates group bacterium]